MPSFKAYNHRTAQHSTAQLLLCLKSCCDAYQNRNLNFCLALRSSVPYFSPHSRPLLLCAVNLLLSLAPKLNTAQHSTAQHSTAQHSRAAVCFCFCFLFLSLGMESSRAEQSNAQHSEQSSKAEQSNAQHSRAEQSRVEHRLSTEHSTAMQSSCLVFLISSFCILLFYVSASVSCCCLKSFCDAYQNRNLNFCLALRSSVPYFSPHSRPLLLCAVNLLLSLAPKLNTAQHSTAQHSTAQHSRAAVCFCFCFVLLSLGMESSRNLVRTDS